MVFLFLLFLACVCGYFWFWRYDDMFLRDEMRLKRELLFDLKSGLPVFTDYKNNTDGPISCTTWTWRKEMLIYIWGDERPRHSSLSIFKNHACMVSGFCGSITAKNLNLKIIDLLEKNERNDQS